MEQSQGNSQTRISVIFFTPQKEKKENEIEGERETGWAADQNFLPLSAMQNHSPAPSQITLLRPPVAVHELLHREREQLDGDHLHRTVDAPAATAAALCLLEPL
ncbi:unnamed protein product [Pleuronectes platessa]|uniref:Uncharacterized protein n=1 Tax=Pleuronectes platessa TaxID=8262 RepID=A0A9N7VIL2_PLEPL|nr:unnamed protein product [Pleuronectes platessa]